MAVRTQLMALLEHCKGDQTKEDDAVRLMRSHSSYKEFEGDVVAKLLLSYPDIAWDGVVEKFLGFIAPKDAVEAGLKFARKPEASPSLVVKLLQLPRAAAVNSWS